MLPIVLVSDAPVTDSSQCVPVIQTGSTLYAVSLDYSDDSGNPITDQTYFHVLSSNDNGVTWTEQDNADAPEVYSTSDIYGGILSTQPAVFNTYDACHQSGSIYVVYVGTQTTEPFGPCLCVSAFSGGWQPPINGPALVVLPFDSVLGYKVRCDLAASFKVRGDGTAVIVYAVGHSEGMVAADTYNVYWTVFNPSDSSWTTPTLVTTDYTNSTPICSVLDSSDNAIFILSVVTTPGTTGSYSFIIQSDNSTVALAVVDPTPPVPLMTLVSNNDKFFCGPVQGISVNNKNILLTLSYTSPTASGVYTAEINSDSLLEGGDWTIFQYPLYANGSAPYIGRNDSIYWPLVKTPLVMRNITVLGNSSNGTNAFGKGDLMLAHGDTTGNNLGSLPDNYWGFDRTILPLLWTPPLLITPQIHSLHDVPYSISTVVMANTCLGVLYSYFDASVGPGVTQYFTRFAVFTVSICGDISNDAY